MAYICSYGFCHEPGGKVIAEGKAVACTKCGTKKPMHEECFTQHNAEKHDGKATSKPLPEIDFHFRLL
jgi:hypothetical protein